VGVLARNGILALFNRVCELVKTGAVGHSKTNGDKEKKKIEPGGRRMERALIPNVECTVVFREFYEFKREKK
jgi:hypothetical protein